VTWAALGERSRPGAAGLAALGVERGEPVSLLLPNTVDCHLVDYAAVHLGAVPFTVYNSSSPEQIAHQLRNAGARVVVTQTGFLPKVAATLALLDGQVTHVVLVDSEAAPAPTAGARTLSLRELEAAGDPAFDLDAAWQQLDADDLVTLIYTSGTTGPPKGVEWSHRTVMAQQRALDAALPLPTEAVISFLPMAHAGGRITVHYIALAYGATITVCPDMGEVPRQLREVHPDAFFSVPRLWEKLQVGIEAVIEALPDEAARRAARDAVDVGLRHVHAVDGSSLPDAGPEVVEAERLAALGTLRPVLATLGLDRIKAAFVGGAPCTPEVVQFFRAVGVPLLEAYGLTEGSLNVFNRVEDFKTGTAGRALPGVELRVGDDGELFCRAELNMVGYRGEPELTAATIDDEGWLATGDIVSIDDDGYVSVVDRKKEIMISAAGKNMSPANIEAAVKGASSLIGQVVTVGDGRRYVTALITLDPEAMPLHARRLGLPPGTLAELAAAPEIRAEVEAAVERGNGRLSRPEQIRKFVLVPTAWAPDSDELTPTAKLKRHAIGIKYAGEIAGLYAE